MRDDRRMRLRKVARRECENSAATTRSRVASTNDSSGVPALCVSESGMIVNVGGAGVDERRVERHVVGRRRAGTGGEGARRVRPRRPRDARRGPRRAQRRAGRRWVDDVGDEARGRRTPADATSAIVADARPPSRRARERWRIPHRHPRQRGRAAMERRSLNRHARDVVDVKRTSRVPGARREIRSLARRALRVRSRCAERARRDLANARATTRRPSATEIPARRNCPTNPAQITINRRAERRERQAGGLPSCPRGGRHS